MDNKKEEFIIEYNYNSFIVAFSLYMGLTPGLFFILHHYSSVYNRLLNTDAYNYPFEKALEPGIFWFLVIFLIMIFILYVMKEHGVDKPTSMSYIITGIFSILCFLALLSQKIINGYTISYSFIISVIIGFTTYIKFYNMHTFIKYNNVLTIRYLELLHDELLRYINLMVHTGLILLSAGVISSFIPQNAEYSGEGLYFLVLNHVYLVIYYLIGLWLGVFAPIVNMLQNIKLKIAYLHKE